MMLNMRTTLTLDDDVARELHRMERGTQRSFKELVNELLRKGLASGARPISAPTRFVVTAKASGFRPGIDPLKLNQLSDQLETERFERTQGGGGKR